MHRPRRPAGVLGSRRWGRPLTTAPSRRPWRGRARRSRSGRSACPARAGKLLARGPRRTRLDQLDLDGRGAVGVRAPAAPARCDLRPPAALLAQLHQLGAAGRPARRRPEQVVDRAVRRPRAGRGRAAGARRPRPRSAWYLPVLRSTTTTRPSSSTSSRSANPFSGTRWPSGSVTSARSSLLGAEHACGRRARGASRGTGPAPARTSSRSRPADQGVRNGELLPDARRRAPSARRPVRRRRPSSPSADPVGERVHDVAEALRGGGRRRPPASRSRNHLAGQVSSAVERAGRQRDRLVRPGAAGASDAVRGAGAPPGRGVGLRHQRPPAARARRPAGPGGAAAASRSAARASRGRRRCAAARPPARPATAAAAGRPCDR